MPHIDTFLEHWLFRMTGARHGVNINNIKGSKLNGDYLESRTYFSFWNLKHTLNISGRYLIIRFWISPSTFEYEMYSHFEIRIIFPAVHLLNHVGEFRKRPTLWFLLPFPLNGLMFVFIRADSVLAHWSWSAPREITPGLGSDQDKQNEEAKQVWTKIT